MLEFFRCQSGYVIAIQTTPRLERVFSSFHGKRYVHHKLLPPVKSIESDLGHESSSL